MTIDDIIAKVPPGAGRPLSSHLYRKGSGPEQPRLGLAVESMRRHTTDEGWQLFQGLEAAGYKLCGGGVEQRGALQTKTASVPFILQEWDPAVVVIQDKREWDGRTAGGPRTFDVRERFTNVGDLKDRPDIFKVTVLKDAQSDGALHREAAEEIGCHAWIVYYSPRIVSHLAPFVRPQHLVRTWHSVDSWAVPTFRPEGRSGAILSGALSHAYPLRQRLWAMTQSNVFSDVFRLPHPGYHRRGCATPDYLLRLSTFKVAICTCSIYGYALRKLVEATACGCRVVTNLPVDEVMPEIDGNLIRVGDNIMPGELRSVLDAAIATWDADEQRYWSARACGWYDFRSMGKRLVQDIEQLRRNYNV